MKLELKHLAAYLPYGLNISIEKNHESTKIQTFYSLLNINSNPCANLIHKLDGVKPILRPLSDLYLLKDTSFHFLRIENNKVKNMHYDDAVYLFENHYDVFGLIPNGLAIDINTLEK